MVSVFLLGPSEAHERVTARAFYTAGRGLPEMLSGDPTLSWNHLARKEAQDIAEQSLQSVDEPHERLAQPGAPLPVMLLHSPGRHEDVPSSLSAIEALLPRSSKVGCTLVGSRPGLMVNAQVLHSGLAGAVIGGGDVVLDLVPFSGAAPVGPEMRVTAVEHERRSRPAPSQSASGAAGWDSCAVISQLDGMPVEEAIVRAIEAAGSPMELCLGLHPPPQVVAKPHRPHSRAGTGRGRSGDVASEAVRWRGKRGGGETPPSNGGDGRPEAEDEAEEDLLDWLISERGHWIRGGQRVKEGEADGGGAGNGAGGSALYDVRPGEAGVGACMVGTGGQRAPLLPPVLAWAGAGSEMPHGPRLVVPAGARPGAMLLRDIQRVGLRLSLQELMWQGKHVQGPGGGWDSASGGSAAEDGGRGRAGSGFEPGGSRAADEGELQHRLAEAAGAGEGRGAAERTAGAAATRPRATLRAQQRQNQCVLEVEAAEASLVAGSRVQLCAKTREAAVADRGAALGLYRRAREAAGAPFPPPLVQEAAAVTHGRARRAARSGPEAVVMTVSLSRGETFFGLDDTDARAVERELGALPMTGVVGCEQFMPLAGRILPHDGFATAQGVHSAVCGVFRSRR